jgi:hypothetical protein
MVKALRMFFSAEGANPWMVVLCLVAAGMAEGFGIATLLPLLTVAQGEGAGDNALGRFVQPSSRGSATRPRSARCSALSCSASCSRWA